MLDTGPPARDGGTEENAHMAGILTLTARFALPALLSAAIVGGAPSAARAAEKINEQDAHATGV
jgi:hypothetical protein